MTNKKYEAPRDGAVLELAKIITSVSGALGRKVTGLLDGVKSSDINPIFSSVKFDGEIYNIDDGAKKFIEFIEGVVNEEREGLELVWNQHRLFPIDEYEDDEDDSNGFEMTLDHVLDIVPGDNQDLYKFIILMTGVTRYAMIHNYNGILKKAFGEDIIPQTLIFYASSLADYVYLNGNIISECSIGNSEGRPYMVQMVTDCIVDNVAVSLSGLFPDTPFGTLLKSWIIGGLFNVIYPVKDESLFIDTRDGGVTCNPSYILSLTKFLIGEVDKLYCYAYAWTTLTPKDLNESSDLLESLAPFNFVGFIGNDDEYMGKYCIRHHWELYRRPLFNSISGLFQYASVALRLCNSDVWKAELASFKSAIDRNTSMHCIPDMVDYIWDDLVKSLVYTKKKRAEYPLKFTMYNNTDRSMVPVLSLYTKVFSRKDVGRKSLSCTAPASEFYVHQEFHHMLDLMTFIQGFDMVDDNLLTNHASYSGMILLYTILIEAYGVVPLSNQDIADLCAFSRTIMDSLGGKILMTRLERIIIPKIMQVDIRLKNWSIDAIMSDRNDVRSKPEAAYIQEVCKGRERIAFIELLVWISKTTIYNAARIVSYLEDICRDYKFDIREFIETHTIADVLKELE